MEYFTFARIVHIVAVVIWIGGVAMVTTVIIPAIKQMQSKKDKVVTFEMIEGKFALIAKFATVLTAVSGFYMLDVLNAWNRYGQLKYWWVTAMTVVWVLFTVVLFILEPFVLHKLYKKYTAKDPDKTFRFIHRFHWVLLTFSLVTIIGAIAGSHGWFFVE